VLLTRLGSVESAELGTCDGELVGSNVGCEKIMRDLMSLSFQAVTRKCAIKLTWLDGILVG